MNTPERNEATIARLLAAAHSTADPAVLARARTRLAAGVPVPRALAWLGTPMALASAAALFVVASALTMAVNADSTGGARETTYASALIGDDGSYGMPNTLATGSAATPAVTQGADSGEVVR